MQVHNPTSQSRYCSSLGRNIEPFEVVDVPDDFELCGEECPCKITAAPAPKKKSTSN